MTRILLLAVREGASTAITCLSCHSLSTLILNGMISKETMALAFHEVCLILQLSTPRVCVGLIEQMKETVHFIRQNSKLKATEVCGVLLGTQCFIGRSEHLFWRLDIPENSKNVDIWYWTGDIVAHDIWQYNRHRNIAHSHIITNLLQHYRNGSQIVPAIGNHETFSSAFYTKLTFNFMALRSWSQWLPEDALQLVRYYTLVINRGFRVIVLNTNYCARLNIWTYYDSVDPADQLKWLIKELVIAEQEGDYVHIVGHVPVDNRECTQAWVYNYLAIVERFSHTITAQFFGHTHADEFRVLYSNHNYSKPIGFEILSPSVTTFQTFNPSYRIITVTQNDIVITNSMSRYDDFESQCLVNGIASMNGNHLVQYTDIRSAEIVELCVMKDTNSCFLGQYSSHKEIVDIEYRTRIPYKN
ncbi:unnamed protein product [Medioppia subpectinata]|uniref:Calcineurin-like phosphoesterase domain-containing protein n=1 Tax=Medioppia subpectinata TaxID=1979941 RepID=A0A7R9Q1D0_9ACAR|nr:unnamed protein product [Medioppia subpectinata]CAG2108413.1 unnamed protein product [Medioppia subpectinata]